FRMNGMPRRAGTPGSGYVQDERYAAEDRMSESGYVQDERYAAEDRMSESGYVQDERYAAEDRMSESGYVQDNGRPGGHDCMDAGGRAKHGARAEGRPGAAMFRTNGMPRHARMSESGLPGREGINGICQQLLSP